MPDDESDLARQIVKAYRTCGIAAKIHGGNLFVEREEGWEGPINPASMRTSYEDDIRTIVGHARAAALVATKNLKDRHRQRLREGRGFGPIVLSDPATFKFHGYDDCRARIYVSVINATKPQFYETL